jgi:4-hydroxy-tetrahydrodipicolinate reductase
MRIILCGIGGRMGGRIASIAVEEGYEVAGIERNDHPLSIKGETEIGGKKIKVYGFPPFPEINGDVAIDFTTKSASLALLPHFAERKIPLVVGTTGFSEEELEVFKSASQKIPVLLSPNMSRGVNITFFLVEKLASLLPSAEVEIFEAHHRYKKDAPSGTALKLGEIIAKARGKALKDIAKFSREGITGERKGDEIGFQVLRGGDIVGEHTVFFILDGERIEITHRALSRDCFARGAIEAAKWIIKKEKGFYSMRDIFL